MRFSRQNKKDANPYEFSRCNNHPVVSDALVNITCDLEASYVVGEHTLFLGKVTDFKISESEKKPFFFYKGKYCEVKEMENMII